MVYKKKVITGTGRCGTTLIMHLLSEYGENTGYTPEEADIDVKRIDNLNAGLEHPTRSKITKNSKWIKNPNWIRVNEIQELEKLYGIDTVYIPIRDLDSTARSRAFQSKHTHAGYGGFNHGAKNVNEQKSVNAILTYHLIQYLEEKGIRYRLISFERMLQDPRYLFHRLELAYFDKFEEVFDKIVDQEKVRF